MEIDPLKRVADNSSLDLDLTLRLEPPSKSEEESIHSTMEIDPSKMPTDNSSLDLDLTLRLEPPSNNEGESIQSTMHIFFDPIQKATKLSDHEKQRSCKECGVTNTPTWRKGPDGPKTLCNKCGLRHSRALRNAAEDWQLEVESKEN